MKLLNKKCLFNILLVINFCTVLFPFSIASAQEALNVTILIYSGRQDPEYKIIKTDNVDHIKGLLKKSPVNEKFDRKSRVIPSILGYKGIVIMNSGISDFPQYIAVYKGNIEVREKEKTFLVDENRVLERYLLELAVEMKALDKSYLPNILGEK